jgi:protein-tyrosine phosphatase
MAELVHWQTTAQPHAVLGRVREVLRAGGLVALPTETGYGIAASALDPAAVGRACELAPDLPALALRSAAEARDWAPGLAGAARRLARRLWPGPLLLAVPGDGAHGLAARLPAEVRGRLGEGGELRLRVPAHEALLVALRGLGGPVLLAPLAGPEGGPAADPAQVLGAIGDKAELLLDDGPPHYAQPATVVRADGSGWQVVRAGVLTEEQLRRQAACLIVFVCTGNTCRSPLAEALCKKRLAERLGCEVGELPARGFFVLSAGLAAMMGGGAAPEAVEVARTYGADLEGHRSRPLTPELAAQADYLVVMTRSHARSLREQFPRLGAEPRLLDPSGADVADPIGCEAPVYEQCGRDVWQHLEALVGQLQP